MAKTYLTTTQLILEKPIMPRKHQARSTHNSYVDLCMYLKELDETTLRLPIDKFLALANRTLGFSYSERTVLDAMRHMGVELVAPLRRGGTRIPEGSKDRAGTVARCLADLMTALGQPIPIELKCIYERKRLSSIHSDDNS